MVGLFEQAVGPLVYVRLHGDTELYASGYTDTALEQWADRLCGVMSHFRPGGPQPGSHLTYSPWCVPTVVGGIKCVVVNAQLRDAEPMAWDFVINFAKDNDLQVVEACVIPDTIPEGR